MTIAVLPSRVTAPARSAGRVLDLKGRVLELEALAQEHLELAADRMAIGAGGDEHVRGERREAGGDRPEVQVVHADDTLRGGHRRADLARVHSSGAPSRRTPIASRRTPTVLAITSTPIASPVSGSA